VKVLFGLRVRLLDPEHEVVAEAPCPNSTAIPLLIATFAASVDLRKKDPIATARSTKTISQIPAFLSSRSGAKSRIDNKFS
jgi:hypothetical protein